MLTPAAARPSPAADDTAQATQARRQSSARARPLERVWREDLPTALGWDQDEELAEETKAEWYAIAAKLRRALDPPPGLTLAGAMADKSDSLVAANQAFYDAFDRRDFAALAALWSSRPTVSCIHPGWDV